jgi:DNA-binding MarR family transcriptional regulator
MKTIEESIQQSKPFESIARKALVNIIYTGHIITSSLDDYFDGFGLSQKQYNVLRIVRGAKGKISTAQVKDRMMVKNADASRIVDRLIQKGLLSKCPNSTDRRQVSIELTSNGKLLLEKIDKELHFIDGTIKNLSNEELDRLNQLLDKLRTNFNH